MNEETEAFERGVASRITRKTQKGCGKLWLGKTLAESAENAEGYGQAYYLAESAENAEFTLNFQLL
jgi:hypothetical protein